MSLRYFTLQPERQSYIRSFSILDEPQTVFNKRVILPDSYPVLFINCGAPFVLEQPDYGQTELPSVFFVRAQTRPLKIKATGACLAIGVNFVPWGTRFLIDEQVNLAASPIVALDGQWRDLNPLLQRTVQRGDIEALATLEQFLYDLYRHTNLGVESVRTAVELLYASSGDQHMSDLAGACSLSPSQMERQFKHYIGLAPKTIARLIRFDAACAHLLNEPATRLTDMAQKLGYVDQAHFIHEFKTFASCTPSQARAYVRWLAADAEFIQFS